MNRRVALSMVVAAVVGAGCSSSASAPDGAASSGATVPGTVNPTAGPSADDRPGTTAAAADGIDPATVPALQALLDGAAPLRRFSLGDDRLGVWVCHVGLDVTDPIYHASDLRLDLDPATIAGLLQQYVTPYFTELSHDAYRPAFVAGGEVSIGAGQTNQDCVDEALDQADGSIDGVVVVADAEHGADQAGGWGRPGDLCPTDAAECPASTSGRATYIGASDFHPDWGAEPAVDLEEHEIGHSIGFPHSGDENRHTSALDLMSNSAAPRDVDPDRRDGPGTLAVNRLAAGWLPLDAVMVAGDDGGSFALVASDAATDATDATTDAVTGSRLLVLPIDDLRFVTVEVITNTGVNDHLPESGVALHLVDQRPSACRTDASEQPCVNELRRQTPLGSQAPHTDLLGAGETWSGEGWAVTVASAGSGPSAIWTVTITREDD